MYLPNSTKPQSKVIPHVFDLAIESLRVHLEVLQQAWPLEGWAVLHKARENYHPVISSGFFAQLCPEEGLERLIYQHWDKAAEYNDYMYRPLSEQEVVSLRSQLNDQLDVQYLFRIPLYDSRGEVVGLLVAACSDLPFYRWCTMCQRVSACVASVSLMVSLLDELGAAEVSLGAIDSSSFQDVESGVLNRAGWIYQLNISEATDKLNDKNSTSVFVVRLLEAAYEASDASIRDAAALVGGLVRGADVVGRIESNTFAIIANQANPFIAKRLHQRLVAALGCEEHHIGVGVANCSESPSLSERLQLARSRAQQLLGKAEVSTPKQAA
ncbi:hypothetical protein L1889_14665 [Paenalcaligenes niemegkensis]|uniref:hypothetical protein n=1 Tax=Paenalcaligenes niemegkensis TaxID=2895469 RepID=UPI001EE883BB|nr:hypothetical protein [Paenalcaligenes niemegkensis]MCQ9617764.1 hypothetical protein [Paenalcaligenes niemegkensis]